jgi:phosphate transport system protein
MSPGGSGRRNATGIDSMGQERQAGDTEWDNGRVTVGRSFLRDLEGLWAEVLKFAAVVEETLDRSVHALCDGHVEQADQVKRQKRHVDRWEVQIERECVRVLALHQPVASDLRRVAAVLKINGDLHRLGDLARHIAKRVKKLAADPRATPIPQPLEDLGLEALDQVHGSLDALTRCDVALAQSVIAADQRVDRDYRAVQKQLKQEIALSPERINSLLRLVNTARNLERIADHASKIAEAVIYLKQGEILRHRPADAEATDGPRRDPSAPAVNPIAGERPTTPWR